MWSITLITFRKIIKIGVGLLLLLNLISCHTSMANQSNQIGTTEQSGKVDEQKSLLSTYPEAKPTITQIGNEESFHKGSYLNSNYGYSVVIPAGLVGISTPPPTPQHGVRIVVSTNPEAYILVDGSYNAAEYETLDDVVAANLDLLKKEGAEIEVLNRTVIKLQNVPAIKMVIRYKNIKSGEIVVQDIITAIRNRKKNIGIIYEIRLQTPEARYSADNKIFKHVVRSWAMKTLPE